MIDDCGHFFGVALECGHDLLGGLVEYDRGLVIAACHYFIRLVDLHVQCSDACRARTVKTLCFITIK